MFPAKIGFPLTGMNIARKQEHLCGLTNDILQEYRPPNRLPLKIRESSEP